jgi:AraC-like DNA-binding protein
VTEFLTLVRVEAAADRLREPGSRISEVALAVGFQSISQFNRSFRAVVGKSPTDWRSAVPQRLK